MGARKCAPPARKAADCGSLPHPFSPAREHSSPGARFFTMADANSPRGGAQADLDDDHTGPELTPDEARQAGPGWHVFAIWGISTAAAACALFLIFAVLSAS